MRFTLTYRGPLRGKDRGAARHKHEVRRALHPQLNELWQHEPLSLQARDWLNPATDPDNPDIGRALRDVDGASFVVLVQTDLKLVAELDILLLRPEKPGAILQPPTSTTVSRHCSTHCGARPASRRSQLIGVR
jgi:hypothetical protein